MVLSFVGYVVCYADSMCMYACTLCSSANEIVSFAFSTVTENFFNLNSEIFGRELFRSCSSVRAILDVLHAHL